MTAPLFTAGSFPSRVAGRRTAGDVVLTLTEYAPATTLPTHAHERACFVGVLAGRFEDVMGGRATEVAQGTVLYRPGGEPHANRFTAGASRCLNAELPIGWTAADGAILGNDAAPLLARLYAEFTSFDDCSPLAVEGLLLELTAEALRRGRVVPGVSRAAARAKEIADDAFAAPLALAAVAREAGVHPAQLARQFRAAFGCTFGEYVRRRRIEAASAELLRSDAPLADIALAAGFCDQSHFANTFKRLVGVTPRAFRRSAGFQPAGPPASCRRR